MQLKKRELSDLMRRKMPVHAGGWQRITTKPTSEKPAMSITGCINGRSPAAFRPEGKTLPATTAHVKQPEYAFRRYKVRAGR